MTATSYPRLLFSEPFNECLAFDLEQKGWCGIASVELENGARIEVFFYDPIRLAQDLEVDLKNGEVCIAEPGLIIIPKVTLEYMERAIRELHKKGYFHRLRSSPDASASGS